MICQRCLLRLSQRNLSPTLLRRRLITTTSSPQAPQAQAVTAETTTATNPRPNDLPAATSTSAAQPFSTPLSPKSPSSSSQHQSPQIQSSVPAGTVLKGLNFMKNQQDPIAMEDSAYPEWLWTVLERKDDGSSAGGVAGQAEGDLFSKSKKQRRLAAKALRRQQLADPESMVPKVPLEEQTLDLPTGEGAEEAREELTKAMRNRRRKGIKEANFLKGMR